MTWNVQIRERYRHGRAVATYLANYLQGGPLHESRLLSCRGGVVRFRYRDNKDPADDGRGKRKVMPLPAATFLSRLLEHVPEPGQQTARGYGLYAGSKRAELNAARACQGQRAAPPARDRARLTWQDLCERLGRPESCRCPVCGTRLVVCYIFSRGRDPPDLSPWLLTSDQGQEAA